MTRADWDTYFMGLAHAARTRSTCPRLHVGAIIVVDRTLVATGYNGSIRGAPHCDDVGCRMDNDHCVRTVHAEANAIAAAARGGVSVRGGHMYATHMPCLACHQLISNAGIERVDYQHGNGSDTRALSGAVRWGAQLNWLSHSVYTDSGGT